MAEHYHPISHVSSIWHRSSSDRFHLGGDYTTGGLLGKPFAGLRAGSGRAGDGSRVSGAGQARLPRERRLWAGRSTELRTGSGQGPGGWGVTLTPYPVRGRLPCRSTGHAFGGTQGRRGQGRVLGDGESRSPPYQVRGRLSILSGDSGRAHGLTRRRERGSHPHPRI